MKLTAVGKDCRSGTHVALNLGDLFHGLEAVTPLVGSGYGVGQLSRYKREWPEGGFFLLDRFRDAAAACCFVRLSAGQRRSVCFRLEGTFRLESCPAGGWLLLPDKLAAESYWFPRLPLLRSTDAGDHILSERPGEISNLDITLNSVSMTVDILSDLNLDWLVWRIPGSEREIVENLQKLRVIETQPVFLWGSHTTYRRPADLYTHLIAGSIYESHYSWPFNRKICSEDDARALYVTLSGLERATGKKFYSLMKQQILISVIACQWQDGGWHHGEWSNEMEAHFRLNGSALGVLLDALQEYDEPLIKASLERGIEYISSKRDQTDVGTWFLHDELELSVERMRNAPFKWAHSRVLGKSPANMLVLNTHLHALIVLDRYRETTGDEKYADLVRSGRAATRSVLALTPLEWLYRQLSRAINLTLLPTEVTRNLPLPVRALKRIAWKYIIPNLHHLKARFPRLVMPGGYIDRAIPLKSWAHHYLTVNIMDLLRYQRRFPEENLGEIVCRAVEFTRNSGMLRRWQELSYEKYALGFWAEALYHLCLLSDEPRSRQWLTEAVLILEKLDLGLPPSLLGANSECVTVVDQRPCVIPGAAGVRVVNLSRPGVEEMLMINTTDASLDLDVETDSAEALRWSAGEDSSALGISVTIAPKGWVSGTRELRAYPEQRAKFAV